MMSLDIKEYDITYLVKYDTLNVNLSQRESLNDKPH